MIFWQTLFGNWDFFTIKLGILIVWPFGKTALYGYLPGMLKLICAVRKAKGGFFDEKKNKTFDCVVLHKLVYFYYRFMITL